MDSTITTTHTIQFAETDMAGFAHFSNYFRWMEIAENALFQSLDAPLIEKYASTITAWPRINAKCNYEAPLRFQDTIEIHLTIRGIHTHSITYDFTFFKLNDATKIQVGTGEMTTVCASINATTGAIKPMPIAETLLSKIKDFQPKLSSNPSKSY